MNIVFWGDAANEFSNRHYLALAQACGDAAAQGCGGAPCRVAAVVDSPKSGWVSTRQGGSNDSPPFDLAARELGIPAVQPEEPNSQAVIASIASVQPDLFVAVGYTRRLGASLLALPRLGAVNFHASLLPAYRGKHPVFWALHFGERTAGLTVHRMDPRIDAGEILYQVRVRTRLDDTVASLYERIMLKSVGLMTHLVRDACRDRLAGRPQEESSSSYFWSTTPEDFRISFTLPAELIGRRTAATPGRCWFPLQGRRIMSVEAALESRRSEEPGQSGRHRGVAPAPGAVLTIGRRHVVVAANPGKVRLRRLAAADGPALPAAALLREAGYGPGDCLEE